MTGIEHLSHFSVFGMLICYMLGRSLAAFRAQVGGARILWQLNVRFRR